MPVALASFAFHCPLPGVPNLEGVATASIEEVLAYRTARIAAAMLPRGDVSAVLETLPQLDGLEAADTASIAFRPVARLLQPCQFGD